MEREKEDDIEEYKSEEEKRDDFETYMKWTLQNIASEKRYGKSAN